MPSLPTVDNLKSTTILNYKHPIVTTFIQGLGDISQSTPATLIQTLYKAIRTTVSPIYSVDERRPVSQTLSIGKGSCSQRMACLEAVCRAHNVPTRVHSLWVSGTFWYPRFRFTRPFIPKEILLLWPQFYLENKWINFEELFTKADQFNPETIAGFTNTDETLFDAVETSAVDFFGKSHKCMSGCSNKLDLSSFVIRQSGFFDTRDDVFSKFGSFQDSLRGQAFEFIFGGRKSR